ncbi:MAG: DMT family transporter [Cohaesibacter sp.]|nr:DMT family transporter [Cohaesibacter sp.]
MKQSPSFAFLYLIFATCAWAGNIIIGRAIRADLPPLGLSFWRWTVAFLILLPFTWGLIRQSLPVLKREWKLLLLMSITAMAIFHPFQYIAVQTTTAINATLILSTCPAVVVVLSRVILKNPVSPFQALGILLAFGGVVVVMSKADWAILASLTFSKGDVWMLGAALAWSIYSISLKYKPEDLDGYVLLATTAFLGACLLLPFYLWESFNGWPMPLTAQAFGTIGYISIVASLLAYLAFNQGLAILGPARAGIMLNLIPVWATLLAILLLGEQFETYHLYGLLLIALGILLNNLPLKR